MKHLIRRLVRVPGFTLLTVATIAIAIGANTAIFSVVESVLIKPLPYPDSDRLVHFAFAVRGMEFDPAVSPADYLTYREESRTFEHAGVWSYGSVNVTGLDTPERVSSVSMTQGTLDTLGVRPALGRWFDETDGAPDGEQTVILMYGYWQRRMGGDEGVIGSRILINAVPRRVIGVMPQGFHFPDDSRDLILPLWFDPANTTLGRYSYQGVARLADGVTVEEASADMSRMLPLTLGRFPPPGGYSVQAFEQVGLTPELAPLKQYVVGDVANVLWVLLGAIGAVLLIACANVANLLLVRADDRLHELTIRAALGAGWGRIMRELISESLALAAAGGALGLALAWGALRLLLYLAPSGLPRLGEIGIDATALAFTAGVTFVAGLLPAILPAVQHARPHLAATLRAGGRSLSQSRERRRLRNVLVVVQVALALVLLVCSGLMIRSFQALRNVAIGFQDPDTVQTVRLTIPQAEVEEPAGVVRLQQQMLEELARLPGVTSVGLAGSVPLDGDNSNDPVYLEGVAYANQEIPPLRQYKRIGPGYLATIGQPIIAGRDVTWEDLYDLRPVAWISENLARELAGTPEAAIGRRVREMPDGAWREIAGVVGDVRLLELYEDPPATIYIPILTGNFYGAKIDIRRSDVFVLRTERAGMGGFLDEIRQTIWSMNRNLPLAGLRTLGDYQRGSMARTSFTLVMLGLAGGMALLLGVVGIYGVISYGVAQRTREIGIRMALGADQPRVKRMFVRDGLVLAAIGVACGLGVSFWVMRLMSGLLFGVEPADPLTYAAVAVGLIAAAALASYLPARRASAVDPINALRAE